MHPGERQGCILHNGPRSGAPPGGGQGVNLYPNPQPPLTVTLTLTLALTIALTLALTLTPRHVKAHEPGAPPHLHSLHQLRHHALEDADVPLLTQAQVRTHRRGVVLHKPCRAGVGPVNGCGDAPGMQHCRLLGGLAGQAPTGQRRQWQHVQQQQHTRHNSTPATEAELPTASRSTSNGCALGAARSCAPRRPLPSATRR